MTTTPLEKELLKYTRDLPKEALQEVLDFIQFIRQKRMNRPSDSITAERSELNSSQITHLKEEFKDYRQLYPHENE